MKSRQILFFLVIWGASLSIALAQRQNIDSLKGIASTAPRDSNLILSLLQIGDYYESVNLDSSEYYYRKALQLSKDLKLLFFEGKTISWFTDVLNQKGKLNEALQLNLRSLEIGKQLNHSRLTIASYANVANTYQYLGEYEATLQYQLEALSYIENMPDSIFLSTTLNNISGTYQLMRQFDKARPYAQRALGIARKIDYPFAIGGSLLSMGIIANKLATPDQALTYFLEALQVAQENNLEQIQGVSLLNIGEEYQLHGSPLKALPYLLQGVPVAQSLGDNETLARLYLSLADVNYELNHYTEAANYIKQSINISREYHFRDALKEAYLLASDIELMRRNFDQSAQYRKAFRMLSDSIINETVLKNTAELETKYKTAQKETEIEQLTIKNENQQLRIRQRNGIIFGMGGLLALLGIISSLYYNNTQNKQKIATQDNQIKEQKIRQLEQEKQLSTVDAMLRGQEAERSRLARDLHDGLGGMLSGVRQTLNAMKGNQIVSEESARAFTRALDMLDTSISELRRVARNMMPEALVKFGLKDAVQDFTDTLNDSGIIQVQYQAFGLEKRLPEATEVIVFRIVQELLNNVVKHAHAHHVLLQLLQDGNRFHLTIEDDGKGFDLQKLEEAPGIGWMNIRSRVNYLGGTLDVRSAPAQGTTVEIEFMIKENPVEEQLV